MAGSALYRAPQFIAAVTLGAGVALLAAPSAVTATAGLGERPGLGRVIGAMDLALVPGLWRGRPRWPWMLARAAFNLPIAAAYRDQARRDEGSSLARGGMLAMLGLSTMDLATAVALRNAERPR